MRDKLQFIGRGELNMKKMPGNNNFKDDTYDYWEWSAPILHTPEELKRYIEKFNIIGKEVYDIKVLGHSLYHSTNWVEDTAYRSLTDLPENERQRMSEYRNIPDDIKYPRMATIDEVILIMLDDGNVLALEMVDYSKVRVGLNEIPWDINPKYDNVNVDLGELFSHVIYEEIADIEIIEKETEGSVLYDRDGNALEPQEHFIDGIFIHFENGFKLGISMCMDWCEVYCVDDTNEVQEILFRDLRNGLHNEEDRCMGKNYQWSCQY